jgi:prepilin-type N-terminal cleavage/methylation domain-containing protein
LPRRSATLHSSQRRSFVLSRARGFTLIELLVVIAIIAGASALAFGAGISDYRRTQNRSARDTITSALMHARAQAMANTCFGDDCTQGRAHGVKVFSDNVTVFQASTTASALYYDHRDSAQDEITTFDTAISTTSQSVNEIVFLPLSGSTTNPAIATITIISHSPDSTSTITISPNGKIDW